MRWQNTFLRNCTIAKYKLYLNLTVSENEISLLLTDMGLEDFSYQLKAREQNKIRLLKDFKPALAYSQREKLLDRFAKEI